MFNSKFGVGVLKHPGYNVGGGIGEAALLGAAFGGAKSLATGEDLLEGALLGGITGGAMSGVTGAIFGNGANAAATAGATSTEQAAKVAAEQAAQQTANASLNVADTFSPALTSTTASAQTLADMEAAKQAIAASGNVAPVATATPAGGISDFLSQPGVDLRQYTTPDTMMGKGLDWWEKQGTGGRAMYSGVAGAAYGMMNPNDPEMLKLDEQKSKLAGYNREGFTPYSAEQPDPYYAAQYRDYRTMAEGGIAALANGGMGNNVNFPQGRLDSTQYATPTQLPASASVINADYEQATDPYSGSPIKMAEGGAAEADKYTPTYSAASTTATPTNYSLGDSFSLLQAANPGIASSYLYGNGISAAPGLNAMISQPYNRITGQPISPEALQQQYASPAPNPQSFASYTNQAPLISQAPTRPYIVPQAAPAAPTTPAAPANPANPAIPGTMQNSAGQPMKFYGSGWGEADPNAPYLSAAWHLANGAINVPEDSQEYKDWFAAKSAQKAAEAAGLVPPAAAGGLMNSYASGGIAGYNLGGYASGGNPRLLKGPGDGMSDNIPATIGGRQPARLADGEFVVPADVVSHLGNGSTDAGAKHLYGMMDKVRKARTGSKKQGKQINPAKYMPA